MELVEGIPLFLVFFFSSYWICNCYLNHVIVVMNAGELGSDFQQVWLWDATYMVHSENCLTGK